MEIKLYQTGCGDAIRISYLNKKGQVYNLFVDGGHLPTYFQILKGELESFSKEEQIDLWILTHLDADHINGVIGYLRYASEKQIGLLKRVWFNFFDTFFLPENSSAVSFGKAIELRNRLCEFALKDLKQDITNCLVGYELGDAKITILSPDTDTYDKLSKSWRQYESEYQIPSPAESVSSYSQSDDKLTIEDLSKRVSIPEDKDDVINRSSIAFLMEVEGCSILFLGDAHASTIVNSLKPLILEEKKIKIDFVKLSHHGSINNFNCELLDLIECSNYIVSSNGENRYGLPNKEVLAKILNRPNRHTQINFYFNYDCKRYREFFSTDKDAFLNYNFKCIFPKDGERFILIHTV